MKEVFKDIYFVDKGITYDYRGLYQVSNQGNIKSFPRKGTSKEEKIIKPYVNKKGYLVVRLNNCDKTKSFGVHRLVAFMFIPNINNMPEVNHKDENKQNNSVENLEWCTTLYNIQYSKARTVEQYDLQGNYVRSYIGVTEATRQTKIIHISDCCNGKRQTAGGYIWKYKDAN